MSKMYIRFIIAFLIAILNSCSPERVTELEMREVMDKATFDENGIRNLKKYENLKVFLENNIDTIINFRYHKNVVNYLSGEDKSDSTYLSDDDCYSFFQGNDQYDITNVPDHLKNRLDSLFHTFSEKEFPSFEICKDKKITIEFKRERFDNNLALLHTLIWNTKASTELPYNKDSVLLDKCVYRIRLTELGR